MKKIILFYGSFDPIHNGHIKIAQEALKLIEGDKLYFGLNKNSNSKNLTPFSKRKKMLELAIKSKKKFDILDIKFDYKKLDETYDKLFELTNNENEYYILVGQDQLNTLTRWYKFDLVKDRFKFIIANRNNEEIIKNSNYLYLNNKNYNVSSSSIKEGNYKNINSEVKKYIIENNVYVEYQLKKYLTPKRLKHVKSVRNLALKIYKTNKEGLDKNKIITATMLHDVAREYSDIKLKKIVEKYYPERANELSYILHQYAGEYIAKKKFYIEDENVLEAIRWHTTGSERMSKLAKLVYVSDKLDPLRPYDTTPFINECIKDLDNGFIEVLKDKLNYSIKKDEVKTMSKATKSAVEYYLKGEIDGVRISY